MQTRNVILMLLIATTVPCLGAEPNPSTSEAAKWGAETLEKIHAAFYMPDRKLYAVEINNGKKPSPSWIWDASIQLGALDAAAKVQPKVYLPQVKSYAAALRAYRTTNHDRPGLDVNPPPKKPDRYYDDNAWIAMSLLDAYGLTHDQSDLHLALDAYNFAISGEDSTTLDGGNDWHEDVTRSKNACSSGPAMIDALKLFEQNKDQKYLETAKRLYDWQRAHLQDKDGLVFDSIATADGRINRAKLTYNCGTLITASCLLYQATHEQKYLDEAQRISHAAEKRFVRESDGLITGWGKLGVKLVEAFLELYETDHDDHWRQIVGRCIAALHQHCNANGWYPLNWEADPPPLDKPVRLIDQSAPARAYWIAAEHGVQVK
jgi:hypothetical protein